MPHGLSLPRLTLSEPFVYVPVAVLDEIPSFPPLTAMRPCAVNFSVLVVVVALVVGEGPEETAGIGMQF